MKIQKNDTPVKNKTDEIMLDDYEKELVASLENDEWEPIENTENMKEMFVEAAYRHKVLNQSKKVTLRVNQGDLIKLKAKAKRTNVPYQTLLNALIRNFVEGDYSVKL